MHIQTKAGGQDLRESLIHSIEQGQLSNLPAISQAYFDFYSLTSEQAYYDDLLARCRIAFIDHMVDGQNLTYLELTLHNTTRLLRETISASDFFTQLIERKDQDEGIALSQREPVGSPVL